MSAVKRFTVFLKRETRNDEAWTRGRVQHHKTKQPSTQSVDSSDSTSAPLYLSRASFRVGSIVSDCSSSALYGDEEEETKSATFTVGEFDLSVKKGEVLAICGPVGGGKSCLINGIIDEVPAATPMTQVSTKGAVAYVSQTPFILNASLRDNVLFGRPFKPDVYNRVLDACCLRPDLEQLGEGKDLTEIGERGVTLSGGKAKLDDGR